MVEDIRLSRQRVARAGRAYLAKDLSWEKFKEEFGSIEDNLVGALFDLIEHEPKRGGFWGVNEKEWARYQAQIVIAIEALES